MTNWEKIEEQTSNINQLKHELKLLRAGQKSVVKNRIPVILYARPWESIVKKVNKEKQNAS
jgi:hypothetical protein